MNEPIKTKLEELLSIISVSKLEKQAITVMVQEAYNEGRRQGAITTWREAITIVDRKFKDYE